LVTAYWPKRVHDYTNKSKVFSKALSLSGAQVQLYKGSSLVASYHVPINQDGNLWRVFEIDNGKVVALNSISSILDPADIQ
jgi:hypothetical protein